MNPTFKLMLKRKRKAMGKHNRVKTLKNRPMKLLYPWSLEQKYARLIKEMLRPFIQEVIEAYRAQGERMLKGDSLHLDALPGDQAKITYKQLKARLMEKYPELYTPEAKARLEGIGGSIKGFVDKEFQKQIKQYLGMEFDLDAPYWPSTLESWGERNYELIKSLASQYITRVNEMAEKAITSGTGYYDLMKDIESLGQTLPEGRSRLIARDQVGKLNGRITKATQQELGIDEYVWMTAMNERVRGNPGGRYPNAIPSHYVMEGKVCDWNDASTYSDDGGVSWQERTGEMPDEHPGEAIACRCTSAPNWRALLQSLDQELDYPV